MNSPAISEEKGNMEKANVRKSAIMTLGIVLAAGAGFWGGMTYQRTKTFSNLRNFTGRNGNNQGNRMMARASGSPQNIGMTTGRGLLVGEVSKVDDTGLTLKMLDGSSKIIIVNSDTKYKVSTSSSKNVIKEGGKVTIQGTQGNEGITLASTITIDN